MDAKKLDSPTVEQRLAKLEKQNRRLKVAGAVALALVGALVFGGAAERAVDDDGEVAEVIKAREFRVVDKEGKSRARLRTEGLFLLGEDGNPRAALLMHAVGATSLMLDDEAGKVHTGISASPMGSMLSLDNRDGKLKTQLEPLFGVTVFDKNGEASCQLDAAGLRIYDEKRGLRVLVGSTEGQVPVALGLQELRDLPMALVLKKLRERPRFLLVLLDEECNVIWQAPPPHDAPEEAEARAE